MKAARSKTSGAERRARVSWLGTVTVNPDGGFTYKLATNYVGADTFTYAAKSVYDNQVSAPATVTITIKAHYDNDGCDHDRSRNRDSCSHEQQTSHHNDGDNCDHDRGSNCRRDGDDCDHDRNRNGHYDGDRCEDDSHHGDDDNTGTSGCLIQGAGQGRMTGGGTIGTSDARHGFKLSCSVGGGSNNLEVNWGGGNEFHLERLMSANCTKDLSINAEQPSSSFHTYQGAGNGRYNGASGASATWTFTDGGEPGRGDKATIVVKNAAGQVSCRCLGRSPAAISRRIATATSFATGASPERSKRNSTGRESPSIPALCFLEEA